MKRYMKRYMKRIMDLIKMKGEIPMQPPYIPKNKPDTLIVEKNSLTQIKAKDIMKIPNVKKGETWIAVHGTEVNLSTLKPNQRVAFGDGKTFYWLITEDL